MSALLARELNEPCLVIAPPHLLDEHNRGSWPNVFREFGVRGYLCESIGKLESLLDRDLSRYATVFIDESHRYFTRQNRLARVCGWTGLKEFALNLAAQDTQNFERL